MIKTSKKPVGNGFFCWSFTLFCPRSNARVYEITFVSRTTKSFRDAVYAELYDVLKVWNASYK